MMVQTGFGFVPKVAFHPGVSMPSGVELVAYACEELYIGVRVAPKVSQNAPKV